MPYIFNELHLPATKEVAEILFKMVCKDETPVLTYCPNMFMRYYDIFNDATRNPQYPMSESELIMIPFYASYVMCDIMEEFPEGDYDCFALYGNGNYNFPEKPATEYDGVAENSVYHCEADIADYACDLGGLW